MGLYSKLAVQGMKKNGKLYVPYLLTCILMVVMFYIMNFLAIDKAVSDMSGGESTQFILYLGLYVIGFFSLIFLFYTNSFLIKRRKKEFGLYNVLGMGKRAVGKILVWEVFLTAAISIGVGLAGGIALSKLAELGLIKLLGEGANYYFNVPGIALRNTIAVFAGIFALILIDSYRQVRFSNAIELVKSENLGEKPPKANWIVGILGVIILGAAYYLAIAIEEPLTALLAFMFAVIMVIIGTYMIFIAGSVVLCRMLQKNTNFYYKAKNFVSVSSMSFRMKRNGAGLASICILLTMVLVMISSSACLWFGREDCLAARYPREMDIFACGYIDGDISNVDEISESAKDFTDNYLKERGYSVLDDRCYYEYSITGLFNGTDSIDIVLDSESDLSFIKYEDIVETHFISTEIYNRIYGENVELNDDEVFLCAVKFKPQGDELTIGDTTFRVVGRIDDKALDLDGASETSVTASAIIVVNDANSVATKYEKFRDYNGEPMLLWRWYYQFDTDMSPKEQSAACGEIGQGVRDAFTGIEIENLYANNRDHERGDFIGTFGTLFFIAFVLGFVFLVGAVLIIYYKQLSEGYEDQSRFAIMQKVGMNKKDIKKSINSQMLTVFFLPIIFSFLHIAFAYPFVQKMLMLFGLFNYSYQIWVTAVSCIVTAVLYTLVYKVTSNTYFKIVS